MHPAVRTAITAAVLAALLGVPAAGAGAAGPVAVPRTGPAAAPPLDLAGLQAELAAATARTDALSQALERAAAADGGLRVALERLTEEHDRAQARLDARVRQVWIARVPDPTAWSHDLGGPALRRIAQVGSAAAVRVDRELVDAVSEQSAAAEGLRGRAEAFRADLRVQAAEALAAQDRARGLLAQAVELVRVQAAAATAAAERARLAAEAERLTAVRASLDSASATVTVALTPAQSARSRRAHATEAPLVTLVEAAGAGYPQGYAATGQVLRGQASWYGPGFVGSPTASGSPYDPERLTCAHKTLPLGTVVRVSGGGRAISCLVNDRGPYVGARILDLSRAGSRALGFDGVLDVVVEVLAPQ